MPHEMLPDGFVTETAPEPKPVSPRRLAANKANAQRSTGPKSEAGKRRSRSNALKHGLAAEVVEVPGEDSTLASNRLNAWSASLNPGDDPVVGYLAAQAVRASLRLDRCHRAHEAAVAHLVRGAAETARHERLARVEQAARDLTDSPDGAGRVLRSTSEGCAYLVGELKRIKLPLMPEPPLWDHDDALHLLRLKGLAAPARGEGPSPLGLAVIALAEYRATVEKLRINERPQDVPWNRRYPSEAAHQAAIDALPELTRQAQAARDEVALAIDAEIADLESRREILLAAESLDASEAPARALFDAGDAAKILHRYEQDTQRSLLRTLKEIRDISGHAAKMTKADTGKHVASTEPSPAPRPPVVPEPRNEPNDRPAPLPDRPAQPAPIGPVDQTNRPRTAPTRRR